MRPGQPAPALRRRLEPECSAGLKKSLGNSWELLDIWRNPAGSTLFQAVDSPQAAIGTHLPLELAAHTKRHPQRDVSALRFAPAQMLVQLPEQPPVPVHVQLTVQAPPSHPPRCLHARTHDTGCTT